jgi:anti-sigma28 factor (negative regulator of flagellin synthesis)
MKLTNTSIETIGPGGAAGAGAASGAGSNGSGTAAAKAANSDTVNLSSASQLLSLAKTSASDRTSKLANVAALLRSGQYSTDTASVSRAVVDGHIQ